MIDTTILRVEVSANVLAAGSELNWNALMEKIKRGVRRKE